MQALELAKRLLHVRLVRKLFGTGDEALFFATVVAVVLFHRLFFELVLVVKLVVELGVAIEDACAVILGDGTDFAPLGYDVVALVAHLEEVACGVQRLFELDEKLFLEPEVLFALLLFFLFEIVPELLIAGAEIDVGDLELFVFGRDFRGRGFCGLFVLFVLGVVCLVRRCRAMLHEVLKPVHKSSLGESLGGYFGVKVLKEFGRRHPVDARFQLEFLGFRVRGLGLFRHGGFGGGYVLIFFACRLFFR